MRHAGTGRIETCRLILRQLLPQDAEMMYHNWASDPEVTRFLRWEPHKDSCETWALLTAWAELYANPDYYQWAIQEKSSGEVVGAISLVNNCLGEAQARTGWADHTGEIWEPGYCLGRAWWGRGYMTEALQAVVDYWFSETDGQWLACCHAVNNPASGAVMRKVGFVYDHDTVYHKFDGTEMPCLAYQMTRERWQEHKEKA